MEHRRSRGDRRNDGVEVFEEAKHLAPEAVELGPVSGEAVEIGPKSFEFVEPAIEEGVGLIAADVLQEGAKAVASIGAVMSFISSS